MAAAVEDAAAAAAAAEADADAGKLPLLLSPLRVCCCPLCVAIVAMLVLCNAMPPQQFWGQLSTWRLRLPEMLLLPLMLLLLLPLASLLVAAWVTSCIGCSM